MIFEKLYPYQKSIVLNQLVKGKTSHALFMDMGTGKTITSLALFEASTATKLLVICPVSKIEDWKDDVETLTGIDLCIPLRKGTKGNIKLINEKYSAYVVNYESVWRLDKSLLDMINDDWFIIVDESHKIKSRSSKVSKFMTKLGKRTTNKCILTGTPQSHGYIDYHKQLQFVDILDMTNKQFDDMFCVYGMENFNGTMVRALKSFKNTDYLDKIILENCVFFERSVDDDMIPQNITIKIPKSKEYDTFKKDRVFEDILGDTMGSYRMGLKQLASGFIREYDAKHKYKIQWLQDFLTGYEERVVIFYNFNRERDDIVKLCEKLDKPWSQYNSASKDLSTFIGEDNGIAICNYASAAESLNSLTVSNTCIFYSPTDDYILFEQAKKRIDRLGQTKKPLLYYLQTTGTLEPVIYNSLKNGKNFDDKMFENYLQGVNYDV